MTEHDGVERSTATERLRELLDERGVKWTSERVSNGVLFTFAKDGRTYSVFVRDRAGLEIWSQYLTPEQAIEAMLGRGTCRDVADTPQYGDKTRFECSECGYEYSAIGGFGCDYGDEPDFRFCPNCGRKVVDA